MEICFCERLIYKLQSCRMKPLFKVADEHWNSPCESKIYRYRSTVWEPETNIRDAQAWVRQNIGHHGAPWTSRSQWLPFPYWLVRVTGRRSVFQAIAVTFQDLVGWKHRHRLLWGHHDYTHFIIWELLSQLHRTSVTQALLPGVLLCDLGASIRYFLWAPTNYMQEFSGN